MIELLQFRHSPYNEKIRWALDLKRVPHRRRSLLPGPHMGVVKKLTGHTQTPVLVLEDGSVVAGSARIVEWLERQHPEPRLLPDAPADREQALAIQQRFDDDITPRIRRSVLDALLRRPRYFAAVFAEAESPLKQRLYSFIVPLAAPVVRKGNGITGAAAVADGIAAAHEALDFVAAQAKGQRLPGRRPFRHRRHHRRDHAGHRGATGQLADAKPATGRSTVRGADRALPRASGSAVGARHLRPAPCRQRRLRRTQPVLTSARRNAAAAFRGRRRGPRHSPAYRGRQSWRAFRPASAACHPSGARSTACASAPPTALRRRCGQR